MKRNKLIALSLIIPVLASLILPDDELRFAPPNETTLAKSFKTKVELSLDETRIVTNGEEQDASMLDVEMTMVNTSEFAWTDTYSHVERGQPGHVARTFKNLNNITATSQSNPVIGSMDFDVESTSELTGLTVNFTWDTEKQVFLTSFPEGEDADTALLLDLSEDTDLRGFLPKAPIQVGDSWSVNPEYLVNLMGPGGNLKLIPNEADLPEGLGSGPGAEVNFTEMLGEVQGDMNCEYKGLRDIDGQQLAAVAVSFEVSSANNLTEMIQKKMGEIDLSGQGIQMDFQSAEVELEVSGEGLLLWDLSEGHFTSFLFNGEISQVMDMAMNMETPMGKMEIEQTIEMSGTIEFDFNASKE